VGCCGKGGNKLKEVDPEASRRGRMSKRKGATYERTIKQMILDTLGIQLERTPQSGGFAKHREGLDSVRGDLNTFTDEKFLFHVECKNQAKWSLKAWFKQANDECPKGKIPIVVFHQGQLVEAGTRVDIAEDFVMIRARAFFDLVDTT